MNETNLPGLSIFTGVMALAALLGALAESALLTRWGWTSSRRGLPFALIANGAAALGMAALVYAAVTRVLLGALSGSGGGASPVIPLLLLLASPFLIFGLRVLLLRQMDIGPQQRQRRRYAAGSTAIAWIASLLAVVLAIWLANALT